MSGHARAREPQLRTARGVLADRGIRAGYTGIGFIVAPVLMLVAGIALSSRGLLLTGLGVLAIYLMFFLVFGVGGSVEGGLIEATVE